MRGPKDDLGSTLAAAPGGRESRGVGEGSEPALPEGRSEVTGDSGVSSDALITGASAVRTAGGTSVSGSSLSSATWRGAAPILELEELERTRVLLRLTTLVGAAATVALWLPKDEHPGRTLATCMTVGVVLLSLLLAWRFRRLEHFDRRVALLHGVLCIAAILAVIFHIGVFSTAIIALGIGVYFFGLSDSERSGWVIFLVSTVGYGALVLFTLTGLLPQSQSLLPLAQAETVSLTAVGVVSTALLGLTFWMARRSREATLGAFARLDRAARQIKKRDALLNEAQADLDRALHAKLGLYSGRQVGPYDVEEVIGRGAMGEVYSAAHRETGEVVALKLMQPSLFEDKSQVERFLREADIAGGVTSPHVVKVHGTGQGPGNVPYIAMELLVGQDLAWQLRRKKRLGMSATVELVSQVARGLDAAHAAGVVHRDLKPQNLFRCENRTAAMWKILDFGVSKARSHSGTLTQGGAVGTPSYMAPEQARGYEIDARADVFALAVVTYRVVTGRPAFTGPDLVSTLHNVLHVQPVRPRDLVRVDQDVERVLALGLAKDAERRFASAGEFAAALQSAAAKRLEPELRARADAQIERAPWGMDLDATRAG